LGAKCIDAIADRGRRSRAALGRIAAAERAAVRIRRRHVLHAEGGGIDLCCVRESPESAIARWVAP
jgi:hypothetical protein